MRKGKEAGVAKVLLCEGTAAPSARHAGMGIVVGPRHVLTCAHVVNTAAGHAVDAEARPDKPIRVVFPFSEKDVLLEGKTVTWHPMGARPVGDVAVIELSSNVPADVGVAVFLGEDRPLDPFSAPSWMMLLSSRWLAASAQRQRS